MDTGGEEEKEPLSSHKPPLQLFVPPASGEGEEEEEEEEETEDFSGTISSPAYVPTAVEREQR